MDRSPLFPTSATLLSVIALLSATGCSKSAGGGTGGLPIGALDQAIARALGDPSTCLLLADRATGKVLYRYGESFNCVRGVPACDRPGYLSATQALALAGAPGGRGASCPSVADGSRTVGWAEGVVSGRRSDLLYSAVREGQTALPGHEMASRLDEAFQERQWGVDEEAALRAAHLKAEAVALERWFSALR